MASNPTTTTPAKRLTRLLGEGARFLAVYPGQAGGIDVTHDVTGLLDEVIKPETPPPDHRREPESLPG